METLTAWAIGLAMVFAPTWFEPGKNPETPERYGQRMHTIGEAVALEVEAVTDDVHLQRMMVAAVEVTWHAETSFNVLVHSGERNGDPFMAKHPMGRARCLGQHHQDKTMTRAEWVELAGTSLPATRRCARLTVRRIRGAVAACAGGQWTEAGLARAFRRYAKGNGCQATDRSRERAARWQALVNAYLHRVPAPRRGAAL